METDRAEDFDTDYHMISLLNIKELVVEYYAAKHKCYVNCKETLQISLMSSVKVRDIREMTTAVKLVPGRKADRGVWLSLTGRG